MRRILINICTMLVAAAAGIAPLTAVEPLAVRGTTIVGAESGEAKPLHGVSLAWHHFADKYYNREVIATLHRSWGADVVRAAIGVELENCYDADPERAMRALRSAVDAAVEEDCYVVADWHCHHIRTAEAVEFFRTVAAEYGHLPNLIYEIYNEPEYDTWDEVKAYAVEVITAIRRIDPDNVIIVGCPHWDQDVDIVADSPIEGFDNLVYSFHFYADTHQQANMDRCDYALSKGLPLIISECGAMDHLGGGVINYEWWGRWVDWARRHSVGWIAWSLSDKVETCSMLRHGAAADGQWTMDDLKDWSLLVVSSLKREQMLNNGK